MKTKSFHLVTASLAAMIAPAFALEAPADDAPPPPAVKDDAAPAPKIKIPPVKGMVAPKPAAAFLGVITGDIPKVLADHLVLEKGEGVVVRSLVSDGPAEKAGIAVNDVITKVGENSVGSPADISKQITSLQPGDSVVLHLIHKGQPSKLEVKLESKPAELSEMEQQPLQQLDLDSMPKELADRVRDAIAGNVGALDLEQDVNGEALSLEMKEAMQQMQKRMQGAFAEAMTDEQTKEETHTTHSEATVRMSDNDGSVEVKSKNGAKQVTVRDHQDKVVWSGPWDSAEDKRAAPGDVQARVERLNLDSSFKGGGLRLRMNH